MTIEQRKLDDKQDQSNKVYNLLVSIKNPNYQSKMLKNILNLHDNADLRTLRVMLEVEHIRIEREKA